MGLSIFGKYRKITKDNIVGYLRSVEGQMTDNELKLLFELSSKVKVDCSIVEIGSYRGKSSLALGLGTLEGNNNYVYSIDPHLPFRGVNGGAFGPDDLKEFYKNVSTYGRMSNLFKIALKSEHVSRIWDQGIGLLWIDGDHSEEGLRKDFEGFNNYLIKGGLLAFHDSYLPAVQKVIGEAKLEGFTEYHKVDSITVLKKEK